MILKEKGAKNEKTANNSTPFNTTNKSFVKTHSNNFRTENTTKYTYWKRKTALLQEKKREVTIASQQTFPFSKQKDRHNEYTGKTKARPATSEYDRKKNIYIYIVRDRKQHGARVVNAFNFKRENFSDFAIVSTSGLVFAIHFTSASNRIINVSKHTQIQIRIHRGKTNKNCHYRYKRVSEVLVSVVKDRERERVQTREKKHKLRMQTCNKTL